MFGPREYITVCVKLYSGLDRQANIADYDPASGIALKIAKGARLKKVIRLLGLPRFEPVVYFVNGEKTGPNQKVNDRDVIFVMKPVTGG